jgi:hypothetical protein
MDTWLIIVIAVAAVTLAGCTFLFIRYRKEKARIEAMSPEQRELYEAEKEYKVRVEQADRTHQAKVKEWNKHVGSYENALSKAIADGHRCLGSYKGVKLYENCVVTPQGTAYFEKEGVSATADTAGNIAMTQRVTATRLIAGGIIGGLIFPKKKAHDSRELYLVVQASSFGSVVECDPEHGPRVRQLANTINNAVLNAASARERRNELIAQAEQSRDSARAEREQNLGSADQELQVIKADTKRLDEARKSLEGQPE